MDVIYRSAQCLMTFNVATSITPKLPLIKNLQSWAYVGHLWMERPVLSGSDLGENQKPAFEQRALFLGCLGAQPCEKL